MASIDIPLLELSELPAGLTEVTAATIRSVFPHPTLITLTPEADNDRRKAPLFLSLLLHGNEHSSLTVLQKLATYWQVHKRLPRPLKIFVGNVYAAEQNRRHLPDQLDYNRIWLGGDAPEHRLAERVIALSRQDGPLFASIDIHNNTGKNPLYGCICSLEREYTYLASLFSHTTVLFRHPKTVQSIAFTPHCPSITLECGRSGEAMGIERAYQLVLDVLAAESLDHPIKDPAMGIFQTLARIVIREDVSYGFDDEVVQLSLPGQLEDKNFSPLMPGEPFATFRGKGQPFAVLSREDEDLFDQFFRCEGDKVLTTKEWVGSMFTKDLEVIRQDCLGYVMAAIPPS